MAQVVAKASQPQSAVKLTGLVHLFVIYLVWGSTYLAIRIAVKNGSGFPPFFMGGTRILVAGTLIVLWLRMRKVRLRISRHDFMSIAVASSLLWLGGTGLVTFAEQHENSGYAALLVSTSPIWAALIQSLHSRKWPSMFLIGSMVIGLCGIGLLTAPSLLNNHSVDWLGIILLIIAPCSWALGSVFLARRQVSCPPLVSSAYQQLIGGVMYCAIGFLMHEPLPKPTSSAWWAWAYLVVMGSIVAYTSYVLALQSLPTNLVMTYAYVNPVIAVILGFVILGESLSLWTLAGTSFVVLAVIGVFRGVRKTSQSDA